MPKDKNGNLPDDAVRNFIGLVKTEDYESARRLWYGESKRIAGEMQFEKFCSRYRSIDWHNCNISRPYKGKGGFALVNVDWEAKGEKRHDLFGLKIMDGEWKMERGYYW